MSIGERIKKARENAGLTQAVLGEKIGVSGVAIMRYEKGKRQPRLEQLQRIAAALDVDVNWLMNGQTLEQRNQKMKDYVSRRFEEVLSQEAQTQIDGSIRIHISQEQREYSQLAEKQADGTITEKERQRLLELQKNRPTIQESIEKLNRTLNQLGRQIVKLNDAGQQEAVKRVEELTEIPRYLLQDAPESPAEDTPEPDTPAPPDAAEGPQENE